MSKALQEFLKNHYCNSCGEKLNQASFEVLNESANHVLAKISCPHCGAEHMATITTKELAGGEREKSPAELTAPKSRPDVPEVTLKRPLSLDDVLDFHRFLRKFDGDFTKLFARRGAATKTTDKHLFRV